MSEIETSHRGAVRKPDDGWRFPWIRTALLLMAAIWLLRSAWNHPTGHDVIVSSFRLLAGILSTPLLLETAWFLLGAFILYIYTLRRRHHEGDEWVVMEVDESLQEPAEPKNIDPAATKEGGRSETRSVTVENPTKRAEVATHAN